MVTKINESVGVEMVFGLKRQMRLKRIWWKGRGYGVRKMGWYHVFRKGRVLMHVFSVVADNLWFRLVLDGESLNWQLEEISDGLPD